MGRPMSSRWYVALNAGLAGLIALGLVVAQLAEIPPASPPGEAPTAAAADGPPGLSLFGWRVPDACLTKALTGRPCPGCGMTRSIVLALQLRLARSIQTHPSGVFVAAWLVGQVLVRALLAVIQPGIPAAIHRGGGGPAGRRVWIVDLGVSLAALFLATNLPWMLSGRP